MSHSKISHWNTDGGLREISVLHDEGQTELFTDRPKVILPASVALSPPNINQMCIRRRESKYLQIVSRGV